MKFSMKSSVKWATIVFVMTYLIACVLSVGTTAVLQGVEWAVGVLVVFIVVLIGIVFDMIGIASAAAPETPFHAMAAKRVRGAKHAIAITRNADRFSSFCNDVVGDISGIISGSASALVVIEFVRNMNAENTLLHTIIAVMFTGFVSAITVGGKALGKSFAIHYSVPIILKVGELLFFLESRLGIRVFRRKKTKSNNGKRGNKRAARQN